MLYSLKHYQCLLPVFLLAISMNSYADMSAVDQTYSKEELVLFVRWGKGASEIEYRVHDNKKPRSAYEVPIAMNSFWVTGNGEIYLLDGGKRIKVYKSGKYVKTIGLPELGFLQDFVVLGDAFIFNTSHEVFKISLNGEILNKKIVYGFAKPNRAINELVHFDAKVALTSDSIVLQKSDMNPSYRCLSDSTLELIDCSPNTALLNREQIVDSDGTMYLSHDFDSGFLKISPLSGDGKSYITKINTYSYLDAFDGKYRFICYKTFRLKGDYVYYVETGKNGLKIQRVRYKAP